MRVSVYFSENAGNYLAVFENYTEIDNIVSPTGYLLLPIVRCLGGRRINQLTTRPTLRLLSNPRRHMGQDWERRLTYVSAVYIRRATGSRPAGLRERQPGSIPPSPPKPMLSWNFKRVT